MATPREHEASENTNCDAKRNPNGDIAKDNAQRTAKASSHGETRTDHLVT